MSKDPRQTNEVAEDRSSWPSIVGRVLDAPSVKPYRLSQDGEIHPSRHGGGTASLRGPEGGFFLKFAPEQTFGSDGTDLRRAERIRREASLLRELGALAAHQFAAAGELDDGSWLLTRSVKGRSATEVSREIARRDERDNRQAMLKLIILLLDHVANLHRQGYLHGDLQPPHFFIDDEQKVTLIDFELGRKIGEKDVYYRGALVHFNAPEIAERMLLDDDCIEYDRLSEVYSAASVMYSIYTSKPSTNYPSEDHKSLPRAVKLRCIVNSERRTFAEAGAPEFPELESVLDSCLVADRSQRCPDLDHAIEALQQLLR